MAFVENTKSAQVRSRLNHPVVDSDGHSLDYRPAFIDHLKAVGGPKLVEGFSAQFSGTQMDPVWYRLSAQERREQRPLRTPWWNIPTKNTLDLSTATIPRLLRERLDDIGLDFSVIYAGACLLPIHFDDEGIRGAVCRAVNNLNAEVFAEVADRLTPVAIIPMHTPQEAIAELEHAVTQLKLKAVLMPSFVTRPIAAVARRNPEAARYATWMDTYGLDSEYDYDPVWAKCMELKVVPTFHSHGMGWGSRRSISSYVYNHIGHFGAAGEAVCKSLFLGGVTRRFPKLKFAFLEGGVGWGRSLYCDLIGHWEKRNREAVDNYNPIHLDRELFAEMFERYGGELARHGKSSEGVDFMPIGAEREVIDEFEHCAIGRKQDIRDLFVPHFYFGCEADDPVTASAFDSKANPFGARLNAIFGSDIGHWDVPDMNDVLAEAHELVDKGIMSGNDFRDFVFTNPVRMWTALNPDFFKGTVVEDAVNKLLAG
jgi:predicted TIM-barrel fold metal-dependent hydrolase